MRPEASDNQAIASPQFTDKQGQYLAFIWAYTQINRRSPAEADFERYFEVTAPSVHQMLKSLALLGLIQKTPRVARSITLNVPPEALPILGANQTFKTSVVRY